METFSNGFQSWQETHFEVVAFLALHLEDPAYPLIRECQEQEGTYGMYGLAARLTNQFEEQNFGRFWDGDFIETIDKFCKHSLS